MKMNDGDAGVKIYSTKGDENTPATSESMAPKTVEVVLDPPPVFARALLVCSLLFPC